MPADTVRHLLARLESVRRTGPGRWIARCPAHQDRRPSLSIREGEDGRILIHCFAGCGAIEILEALGLDWPDLFPKRLDIYPERKRTRRRQVPPIPARDALELLDQECLVVEMVANRLLEGDSIEQHRSDLEIAAGRIAAIRLAWSLAP